MIDIEKELKALADPGNALFQAKLAPTLAPDSFLGVRVPDIRELAKRLEKTAEKEAFLDALPHKYYDGNLLHSVLVSKEKKFEEALRRVEAFLPYVDNWAACDTLRPAAFKKHTAELLPYIKKWIKSEHEYTVRFAVDMLMTYYLDEEFSSEYPEMVAEARGEAYYIRMMVAWYFATALAKQWDRTLPYITGQRLEKWTHNKAIQKAIESFRITDEQKEYLRSLKVK